MRYSYTALALAFASATQVIASPERHAARHGHAAFHAKKDAGLPEVYVAPSFHIDTHANVSQ